MIILLSSASHRLLHEQLDQLTAAFLSKAGKSGSVEHLQIGTGAGAHTASGSDNSTAKELWSKFGTGSLFASKRLVIVRGAFELRPTELKSLAELLKKRELPAGTTLVLVSGEPLPAMTKNPLVAFCKKTKTVKKISVPVPSGAAAARELVLRAKKLAVVLELGVARELLDRVVDFDQTLNELDKMSLFALAQKTKKITSDDVENMTSTTLEADVFALLSSLSRGNRADALHLLHEQLGAGAHPLYLLAMLRYQFRSLMLVAEAQKNNIDPRNTGLSPYVIRSMQQTLANKRGRYSPAVIAALFNKLVDADEAIKTSAIDGDVALDLLVLAMSA